MTTPILMPKNTERTLLAPPAGWHQKSYYVVEVAYSKNNPLHHVIFYSGFLNDGTPGGYNRLFHPSDDSSWHIEWPDISSIGGAMLNTIDDPRLWWFRPVMMLWTEEDSEAALRAPAAGVASEPAPSAPSIAETRIDSCNDYKVRYVGRGNIEQACQQLANEKREVISVYGTNYGTNIDLFILHRKRAFPPIA